MTPVEELADMFTEINRMFWAGEFVKVNQLLLDMSMTEPTEVLVGRLRICSCASKDLPDFQLVVNRVDAELQRRGYDPKRLLRGLYESTGDNSN
jgi:hypothetical protein